MATYLVFILKDYEELSQFSVGIDRNEWFIILEMCMTRRHNCYVLGVQCRAYLGFTWLGLGVTMLVVCEQMVFNLFFVFYLNCNNFTLEFLFSFLFFSVTYCPYLFAFSMAFDLDMLLMGVFSQHEDTDLLKKNWIIGFWWIVHNICFRFLDFEFHVSS